MIYWKTVESDAIPGELSGILSRMPILDAATAALRLIHTPVLFFASEARRAIEKYVSARQEESGGLLLGRAAVPGELSTAVRHPIICITDAILSERYEGTSVSLHMDPAIWTAAIAKKEQGFLVVGWFHSHPNLGAFFSGTDRNTQRNFFSQEYSLGYVIDPVRDDHAYFLGPDSQEVDKANVITVDRAAAHRMI
ncbi:MAG: hypothetical protein AMXMBFR37_26940 [Steroidobacteraceae bacterium]